MRANSYDVINRWYQTDHWTFANNRSASSVDDYETRMRLVAAARFEYLNNAYARAVTDKLCQEVIQTGPILEIRPKSKSKRSNRAAKTVEKLWQDWADEIDLTGRLLVGMIEEIVGGECFHLFRSNPVIETVPVDFEQFEGVQIHTPDSKIKQFEQSRQPYVDGLELDERGNVISFYKLKSNPGNRLTNSFGFEQQADKIPASIMVHLFRKTRPGSFRGSSQLAASLEPLQWLRRLTEATVESFETRVSVNGSIETGFPPDECYPAESNPQALETGSGSLFTMPYGWKANMFNLDMPTQSYEEIKRSLLHQIIAPLMIPFNVANSDSSDFNFASGQLDTRIFQRFIQYNRIRQERKLINRLFWFWVDIAEGIRNYPATLGEFEIKWFWPGAEPIDPAKMARAVSDLKSQNLFDEQTYWQSVYGMSLADAYERQAEAEKLRRELMPTETETDDNENN